MIYLLVVSIVLAAWFAPWWGIGLVGLIAGMMTKKLPSTLVTVFTSVFLTFFATCYFYDLQAQGLIGSKMTKLFSLSSHWFLYFGTATVFAAFTASSAGMGFCWARFVKDHMNSS